MLSFLLRLGLLSGFFPTKNPVCISPVCLHAYLHFILELSLKNYKDEFIYTYNKAGHLETATVISTRWRWRESVSLWSFVCVVQYQRHFFDM